MSEATAILCLGSNTDDKIEAVEAALAMVSTLGRISADSGNYPTAPERSPKGGPAYNNRVVFLETALGCDELRRLTKEYETGVRTCHKGPGIAVDIDIVVFDSLAVSEVDIVSDYFREGMRRIGSEIPCTIV